MADGAMPVNGLAECVERKLRFDTNQAMVGFCGPCDRTLTELETDLGITFLRDGATLLVQVDNHRAEDIMTKLKDLAALAEQGTVIDRTMALGIRPQGDQPVLVGRRKTVMARTANQAGFVMDLMRLELAFGLGPAGTGKTYLAVAAAVHHLLAGDVERIILSRPAVEAGEKLGHLPGDMKEKIDPYMQPLYDALSDLIPGKELAKMMEHKTIEIAPLAFMRGRTLSNAFVVLDEAQNATSAQMKMFLTRLGQGARMAITGDPGQIDLPRGVVSGLVEAQRLLKDVDGIGFTTFESADVVRHPLVKKILEAYAEGADA